MKRKSMLGKYGLTGNSGLCAEYGFGDVITHISAPYDSNGKVFIEVHDDVYGGRWERVTMSEAKRRKATIIRCSTKGCDKPAVRLDHLWPYHDEMNACEKHANQK